MSTRLKEDKNQNISKPEKSRYWHSFSLYLFFRKWLSMHYITFHVTQYVNIKFGGESILDNAADLLWLTPNSGDQTFEASSSILIEEYHLKILKIFFAEGFFKFLINTLLQLQKMELTCNITRNHGTFWTPQFLC